MSPTRCSTKPKAGGMNRLAGARQRGLSIVEMMVGVAVGLIATTVIMHTYASSEMYRRNLTGTGDAVQSAAIAAQRIDLTLQGAGAGLVRSKVNWGCKLLATYSGSVILPRSAAFAAPFDGVPTTLRLTPLVVQSGSGSTSDVIVTMASASASGNQAFAFSSPAGGASIVSSVTPPLGVGLKSGAAASEYDLFLAVPQDPDGEIGDCRIVQAATTFATTVVSDTTLGLKVADAPLTISLNTTTYGSVDASILTRIPAALHLGLRGDPRFAMLGVNSNKELVLYDLLNRNDPQVLAENVFLVKVRYGLDNGVGGTINDNAVDEWVSPSESGWTISELMDGKRETVQKIGFIKAVRVAVVMRSSQTVNSDAPTVSIDLFQDLPTARRFSYTLATDEKAYQYQVYEWVIPLRNMREPSVF